MSSQQEIRSEINLADVLKQRVLDEQPIYLIGTPQAGVLDAITRIVQQAAAETGKPTELLKLQPFLPERSVTLTPFAAFVDEPDACMELLLRGAEVGNLSDELYEQAKQIGLEAVMSKQADIKTLVDAWHAEPLLADLAVAVERAFLP